MALDRIFTLRPGGESDTDNAVKIWAGVQRSSALVALEDAEFGVPVESQTLRTRYRTDVGPQSVLLDKRSRVWRISGLETVGRDRWLDIAVTTYLVIVDDTTFVAPGNLPTTDTYNAQTGYTMMKDGASVQNYIVNNSEQVADVPYNNRLITFRLRNSGAAGIFPSQLQMRAGSNGQVFRAYIGHMERSVFSGLYVFRQKRSSITVSAGDTVIPALPNMFGGLVTVGRQLDYFGEGQYLRVLSREEGDS